MAVRPPRLAWRTQVPVNPASVMKLVTTYAALDLLGPAFTWTTPVYVDGPVRDGVLDGNLYIQGQGDPKLVLERLWLLLRRVQGLGIHTIAGDIVLDRSAFEVADDRSGRLRRRGPAALQRRARRAADQFQVGRHDLPAEPRRRRRRRSTSSPSLAGVSDAVDGAAVGRRVRRLARRAGAGLRRSGAHGLRGQLPRRLRREDLGGGLCGSAQLRAARGRRACGPRWAARLKGQVREGRVPAGLKPAFEFELAAAGRGGARHQQVQQQRDGAAAVPHARAAAEEARHAGGRARRAAPVVERAHRHRRGPAGVRQRLGPVARGAHQRGGAREDAAGGLALAADARAGVVAAGHGRRRHAAQAQRCARAARPT